MNLTSINNIIKNKGFSSLTLEEKIIKATDIWEKRNKQNKWGGEFKDKDKFINWYLNDPKNIKRVCYCCGVSEEVVRNYFYNNTNSHKITRNGKRGRMLELDKIDNFLDDTPYDETNCGLLCYVCNNAKSNFINDYETFKPIAKGIKEFWDIKK